MKDGNSPILTQSPKIEARLLTYEQAGEYLSVSITTVKKLARRWNWTIWKLGKAARLDRRQIDATLNASVPTFVTTPTDSDAVSPVREVVQVLEGKR